MFIKHVLALSFSAFALAAPQATGLSNLTQSNVSVVNGGAGGDSVNVNNNTISNNTLGPVTVANNTNTIANNTITGRSKFGS